MTSQVVKGANPRVAQVSASEWVREWGVGGVRDVKSWGHPLPLYGMASLWRNRDVTISRTFIGAILNKLILKRVRLS